jgi:hypothetical protein
VPQTVFKRPERSDYLIELVLRVANKLGDLPDLLNGGLGRLGHLFAEPNRPTFPLTPIGPEACENGVKATWAGFLSRSAQVSTSSDDRRSSLGERMVVAAHQPGGRSTSGRSERPKDIRPCAWRPITQGGSARTRRVAGSPSKVRFAGNQLRRPSRAAVLRPPGWTADVSTATPARSELVPALFSCDSGPLGGLDPAAGARPASLCRLPALVASVRELQSHHLEDPEGRSVGFQSPFRASGRQARGASTRSATGWSGDRHRGSPLDALIRTLMSMSVAERPAHQPQLHIRSLLTRDRQTHAPEFRTGGSAPASRASANQRSSNSRERPASLGLARRDPCETQGWHLPCPHAGVAADGAGRPARAKRRSECGPHGPSGARFGHVRRSRCRSR